MFLKVGYYGVWIGNVSSKCRKKTLLNTFSKYGRVENVNIINSSFCAFISYNNPKSPSLAIGSLYGKVLEGISNNGKTLFRFAPGIHQDNHLPKKVKRKGTGKECYWWRTTGCPWKNCPKLHMPISKEVDFQPWMRR